jgi:hypothetical protein
MKVVSFYEGLAELAEIGLAEEFKALFDEVKPKSLAARLKTNEPCFGDMGAMVGSVLNGSHSIGSDDPRWEFWRSVLFYFLTPVGLRKKSLAWSQIKEKCEQMIAAKTSK